MKRTVLFSGLLLSLLYLFSPYFSPAQLSGTYTIGGTNPDYATPSAAAAALNSSGISGPVIFEIRNGVYNDSLHLQSISGTSPTHTITFRSQSGDSSQVEIRNLNGRAVYLYNCRYIHFHQLSFSSQQILNTLNSTVHIYISNHIEITNCLATGPSSPNPNNQINYYFERGHHYEILNNHSIDGGARDRPRQYHRLPLHPCPDRKEYCKGLCRFCH